MEKKILIAVPCMDMVSARFAQSLATLKKNGQCAVSFLIGSLIYDSRNKLAAMAVQMEADYILWLDSDMVFAPETLERLMATLDAHPEIDVLSGLYFRRGAPFTPVLFSRLEETEDGQLDWADCNEIPDEPFEVAGCGFGCVLMRTEMLLDIAAKEGGGVWFSPIANAGEDCAFCIRARREGYKIYCDPSVELGHMGYAPITRAFYESTKGEATNGNT